MKYFGVVLLAIVWTISAYGQADQARKWMAVLSSDSLAGRGYVLDGQQKSADFIVEQLKEFGLSAAGSDGYKQMLAYPVNTFPKSIEFSVKTDGQSERFAAGVDFLLHPASSSLKVNNKSFQTIKIDALDSLKPKLKSKKIYYVEKTAENAAEIDALSNYFLQHKELKNSLLIIYDSTKLNWFPSMEQSQNAILFVQQPLKPKAKITTRWESELLKPFESANIIGKVAGKRQDSIVIFTAHYDHLGQMGNAIFRGANDNASGVAMLLALAHTMAKSPPTFDTYFIFFTAEEIGLLGSYYFLQQPTFDLDNTKMLVNLDMVGTGDEGIMVVNAKKHHQFFERLQQFNQDKIVTIKARGEACNSDHCYFDQAGIPAVFIYTLGGKKAYHDVNDNGEELSLSAFNALHDLLMECF